MRPITTAEFYKRLNAGEPPKPIRPRPLGFLTWKRLMGERVEYDLEYDKGIAIKAHAACEVMKERGRPCDVFGWAGQFAYDGHLNEHDIKRKHDDPFYTPEPDDCDFYIDIKGQEKRIEVKTTWPGEKYKQCRVYKYKVLKDGTTKTVWHRPDYVIAIKCMDETMTLFKIYGWMTWQDVENYGDYQVWDEGGRWGIPLESTAIKDYSLLLEEMLKREKPPLISPS